MKIHIYHLYVTLCITNVYYIVILCICVYIYLSWYVVNSTFKTHFYIGAAGVFAGHPFETTKVC